MRIGPSLKLALALVGLLTLALPAAADEFSDDKPVEGFPGPSTFLRGAIQTGSVLQTNDFLKGDNLSGEPIDSFNSLRLEFGWQTDGSRDWHHSYNFPSYGIGLYGADYNNDEELGNPTSLYGFFEWPLVRGTKWRFNFDLAFGFTNDWQSYDPVTNPKNFAFGLGRSVHIEGGPNVEYRLAKRWALIGGFTFTHFSNGGTQLPNHGLNQAGPLLFVKYDTSAPVPLPAQRHIHEYPRDWDLTVTGSGGKRNLNLQLTDPDLAAEYLNRSYFIGNLTVGMGKRFSYKSRVAFGLDLGYDESVGDLTKLDAFNNGQPTPETSSWDNFELALFGGFEIQAHRTVLIVHLGYKILRKDLPNRLPDFYQRLGVRQFFYQDWFAGLNVRFHELGSADNLEWTIGYQVEL
jgi:hypothetical protein